MSNSIDQENTLQPDDQSYEDDDKKITAGSHSETFDFQHVKGISAARVDSNLASSRKSPFVNASIRSQAVKFQHYIDHEHIVEETLDEQRTVSTWLISKFPIIKIIATYSLKLFLNDLASALTMSIQLLPKGMAYAMMAGLDKSNGIIVAVMSHLFYPLSGTTPYLSVGPDPIVCLLISNMIDTCNYAHQDWLLLVEQRCGDSQQCNQIELRSEWQQEKRTVIALVTFGMVMFQLIGNLFNAGFISNFLSKPIIDSFVCSAALVILAKQLHYCLNMPSIAAQATFVQNVQQFIHDVPGFFTQFTHLHLVVCLLSFMTLFILFGIHFWAHSNISGHYIAKQIPAVLLVVSMGIGFTFCAESTGHSDWFGDMHPKVAIVGAFDVSFTHIGFKWPGCNLSSDKLTDRRFVMNFKHLPGNTQITIFDLLQHSFILSIVSYFLSMIVSRKIAVSKGNFRIQPNQEMLGLAWANLGSCVFNSFPCGGILAATVAVSHTTAKTILWSVYAAVIMFVLAQVPICTWLLSKLPKSVLAAIVIETVIPLISFDQFFAVGSVIKLDLWQYGATMLICFLFGIEVGIIIGMLVAVFELVYRGTRNRVAELARLPDSVYFKKLVNYPEALVNERILVCRIYDSLFFTNYFPCEQAIVQLMDNHHAKCGNDEQLVAVVINMISVGHLDSTAAFGLYNFTKTNAKKGIVIRLCCLTDSVWLKLDQVGFEKIHDKGVKYKFYKNDHDAVVDIIEHHNGIEYNGNLHMSRAISPATESH